MLHGGTLANPPSKASIEGFAKGLSQIASVADATARAALVAGLTGITDTNPVWAYRQDARVVERYDGTTWRQVAATQGGCRLQRTSGSQSVANGANAQIAFTAAAYDVGGFFNAANGYAVVPAGMGGVYAITASLQFEFGNSTGGRELWIEAGGVELGRIRTSAIDWWAGSVSAIASIASGSIVKLMCLQQSGDALTTSVSALTHLALQRIA